MTGFFLRGRGFANRMVENIPVLCDFVFVLSLCCDLVVTCFLFRVVLLRSFFILFSVLLAFLTVQRLHSRRDMRVDFDMLHISGCLKSRESQAALVIHQRDSCVMVAVRTRSKNFPDTSGRRSHRNDATAVYVGAGRFDQAKH